MSAPPAAKRPERARKPRSSPAAKRGAGSQLARRNPRQDRAQATVDAILAGATRVLVADGFEAINTNSIAAAAGVSIGSLYQYFANKDEILEMVIDRHCGMMTAIVTKGLQEYAAAPLEVMVRGLIRTVLSAQQTERGFFRVLRQQVPRSSRFSRIEEILQQLSLMVSFSLAARQSELRVKNASTAAFLVVHAVDAIIDAAIDETFTDVDDAEVVQELGDLVLLYLQGSHPAVSGQ